MVENPDVVYNVYLDHDYSMVQCKSLIKNEVSMEMPNEMNAEIKTEPICTEFDQYSGSFCRSSMSMTQHTEDTKISSEIIIKNSPHSSEENWPMDDIPNYSCAGFGECGGICLICTYKLEQAMYIQTPREFDVKNSPHPSEETLSADEVSETVCFGECGDICSFCMAKSEQTEYTQKSTEINVDGSTFFSKTFQSADKSSKTNCTGFGECGGICLLCTNKLEQAKYIQTSRELNVKILPYSSKEKNSAGDFSETVRFGECGVFFKNFTDNLEKSSQIKCSQNMEIISSQSSSAASLEIIPRSEIITNSNINLKCEQNKRKNPRQVIITNSNIYLKTDKNNKKTAITSITDCHNTVQTTNVKSFYQWAQNDYHRMDLKVQKETTDSRQKVLLKKPVQEKIILYPYSDLLQRYKSGNKNYFLVNLKQTPYRVIITVTPPNTDFEEFDDIDTFRHSNKHHLNKMCDFVKYLLMRRELPNALVLLKYTSIYNSRKHKHTAAWEVLDFFSFTNTYKNL